MANPVCAPFNDQPLILNKAAGESDESFHKAIIKAAAEDVRGDVVNTDAANTKRILRHVEQMTGLSIPQVLAYAEGAYKAIAKDGGNSVWDTTKRMQVVAGMEQVFMRRSVGIKQLAENFLMQKKEGQLPAIQAFEFLSQLQSFNKMGRMIARENLSAGSALRQKLLAKGQGEMITPLDDLGLSGKYAPTEDPNVLANIDKNIDAFEDLARRIEAGEIEGVMEDVEKIAKQIAFIEDPREIAGVLNRWKSTWNTWDEVWINGLLSATGTFVVNATGAAWVVMRPLLQLGAAEAFAASGVGGAKGQAAARAAAAEAGAQLAAMSAAFQDAAILGWRAAKSEKSLLMETSQKITAKNFRENDILWANKWAGSEEVGRAIDMVGQLVRLPSRGMLGMDEFAKIIALRGEVAANGVRKAVLNNADPTDLAAMKKAVNEEVALAFDVNAGSLEGRYRFDPSSIDDADARAYQYQMNSQVTTGRDISMRAREAVFQEENRAARFANKIGRAGSETIGFAPLKPFIPFTTTPTNILKQGVWESTGLDAVGKTFNIAKSKGFSPTDTYKQIQKELLNDPADTFRVGGQVALMTLVGGTVYTMAMDGRITGGGPGTHNKGRGAKQAQDAWIAAGNVPYSIDLGGGNKLPFDRLGEPFATPMRMIADIGQYSGFMNERDKDINIAHAVGYMAGGLFEASFLKGLNDFMRIASGGAENFDYEVGRGVQNYVATQMPFSSLLAQADRMTNPYKAAYEGATFSEMLRFGEIEMGEGIFGKLLNKLPGFEGQPNLVDQLTGNIVPITPGVGPFGMNPLLQAIPILPRQSKADEVWQAVFEIRGSYGEKSIGTELQPTPEEQQRFNKLMATTTINGKTVGQAILEYRARPEVEEFVQKSGVVLNNARVKTNLDRIIRRYSSRAKNIFINSSPNLAERRQLADAASSANKRGDKQTYDKLNKQIDELVQRAKRGY